MPYLPLSLKPLPPSAGDGVVFPYLFQGPPGLGETGHRYRFAVLAADSNVAAAQTLALLGFERDGTEAPPFGGWAFHRIKTDGPFGSLSDDPLVGEDERLDTYLDLATLHVNEAELRASRVNGGFAPNGLGPARFGLKRSGGHPDGWRFALAGSDDTDAIAPSFVLPAAAVDVPGVGEGEVTFGLVANGLGESEWTGGRLRFNDAVVCGVEGARIASGPIALVAGSSGPGIDLLCSGHLSLPFGVGGLARVELPREAVSIRLETGRLAVYLFPDIAGDPVHLPIDLTFSIVMDQVELPDAQALLAPLESRTAGGLPSLRHRIEFLVDGDWAHLGQPVLTLPLDGNRWSWDDFLAAANAGQWLFSSRELGHHAHAFNGLRWSLADLLGDLLGPVSLEVASPRRYRSSSSAPTPTGGRLTVPLSLSLLVAGQTFRLDLELKIALKTLRLTANDLKFRLGPGLHLCELQVIDLGFLALILPSRPDSGPGGFGDDNDGGLDLEARTFTIKAPTQAGATPRPGPLVLIPGSLTDQRIDNRVVLRLREFDPGTWPVDGPDKIYLRIGPGGLSFHAEVDSSHSPQIGTGGGKPLTLRLHEQRGPTRSRVVLIESVWKESVLFGELDVPGLDDLVAKVELGLRQDKRGQPPVIWVAVDLDRTDGMPLAQFSVGYLQVKLDDFRARLSWDLGKNDWDLSVRVDGRLSLAPRTSNTGGLDDLARPDAIVVRDLDLLSLHRGPGEVALQLDKPVVFDCLDGMFSARFEKLQFGWGNGFFLACDTAAFRYKQPGQLDVRIEVGAVRLEFHGGNRVTMRNPSKLGIDVRIGGSVRFRGAVAWVDNDVERYFAAAGTLSLQGLPEASSLLKFGSGVKLDGATVPNIALYGATDVSVPLFAGVVAKSFGVGLGINNRLAGVGERPNAEAVLANIDRIDPSRIEGWEFVRRNGFFLSIVGTTVITSDEGPSDQINAYVAALVLCLDLDLNVVAAGKLWFSSSVDFVRRQDHWNRPALVGAIAMRPRDRVISAALESRARPAIEKNEQLARVLNNGRIRLSFLLSPRLVDFHLHEVSYQDEFLGFQMLYRGSFRLAVMDRTMLVILRESVTGRFDRQFEQRPGGFAASGALNIALEIAGLLSPRGLAVYGRLDVQLSLAVRAYFKHEWSITIRIGRWKKKFSYSLVVTLVSARVGLGLRGAVAFDESGRFGFDGAIAISVAIASFRLEISPSFRINEGLISEVQDRVAAFEARIEAVRRELLDGGGSRELQDGDGHRAMQSLAVSAEAWLHYEINGWHLLLPRSDATWFTPSLPQDAAADPDTPPPFRDRVTSIEVDGAFQGNAERLATVVPPWERARWDHFRDERDALEAAEAIMIDTAPEEAVSSVPLQSYDPQSDPRVESIGREWWTDEDRARLPDYAIPLRFRSADAALASPGVGDRAETDYVRLVDYLAWGERAERLHRHRVDDDNRTRPLQSRAGVVRILFDARAEIDRALAGPSGSASPGAVVWARPQATTGPRDWFGLWFRLPDGVAWSDVTAVRVGRATGDASPNFEEVDVVSPATAIDRLKELVRPLWARQEHVIDQAGDRTRRGERGRIVVKVPVLMPDEVLKSLLPTVSHWQLWRRLPNESEPSLIADFQQPGLSYLDDPTGPHVVVVGPYLCADEFPTADGRIQTPGVILDQSEIHYSVKPIAVGDTSSPSAAGSLPLPLPVRLHIPPADTLPAGLMMIFPVGSLYHPGAGAGAAPEGWGRFTIAMADDEPGSSGSPRPVTIPLPDGQVRPLRADDFELWAEECDIPGSGYYGGGDPRPGDLGDSPASGGEIDTLRSTRDAGPDETTDGRKFVVPFDVDPDASTPGAAFRIDPAAARTRLRPGLAYRFLVRPRSIRPGTSRREAIGLLRPISSFLTRSERPDQALQVGAGASLGLRPASLIEFVPRSVRQAVLDQVLRFLPVRVDERPLVVPTKREARRALAANLRARIGLTWDLFQADPAVAGDRAGGVEILIRDLDDSAVQDLLVCEMPDEEAYRLLTTDFRNPSAWRPTPLEQLDRLGVPFAPAVGTPGTGSITDALLYLAGSDNPILRAVLRRSEELEQLARPATGGAPTPWWAISPAAKNLLTALRGYERSPLSLNDSTARDQVIQLKFLIKHAFTGLRDPEVAGRQAMPTVAETVRIDTDLAAWLAEAEDARTDDLAEPDDTPEGLRAARRAYLDLDLAHQLASVLRRRLTCVAEVLSASASDDVLTAAELAAESPRLPGQTWFEDLRGQVQRFSAEVGPLVRCQRLLDRMPTPTPAAVVWAVELLPGHLDTLRKMLQFDGAIERRQAAAALVGQAAGLTVAINGLRENLATQGWRLARRPHHQVGVGVKEDGAREAVDNRLADFMDDAPRLDAATGRSADTATPPETGVVGLLNLLERFGFALDFAAHDALGHPVPQDDLVTAIDAADLLGALARSGLAPHRAWVVLGREPDSEHRGVFPDLEGRRPEFFVGHSFAKLVVVPQEFATLLQTRIWPSPIDDSATASRVTVAFNRFRAWCEARRLTLGDSQDADAIALLKRIVQVFAYVSHGMDTVPADTLPRLRLEPRETGWVTVPLVDGRAHIDWTLPDRRGRRLAEPVLGRVVSRYEPLVRWHERFDVPVVWPSGDPAEAFAVRRITLEEDRLTDLDLPEDLPIVVHPDSLDIRFSFPLPAAGARSLYNVISAVRTGYQGYTLGFRYRLRDHDEPGVRGWQRLLAAMTFRAPGSDGSARIADPPAVVRPVPRTPAGEPRLFRHERLVVLDRLPYFFEYWLEARSQYDLRWVGGPDVPTTRLAPEPARREPAFLACRPATLEHLGRGAGFDDWKVTVSLTRTGDLLEPVELAASPPLAPRQATTSNGVTLDLALDRLPEPGMGYGISYRIDDPLADPDDLGVFLSVGEILMPWHPSYQLPAPPADPQQPLLPLHPRFRPLDARVKLNVGAEWLPIVCGQSELHPAAGPLVPAYIVAVQFRTDHDPNGPVFDPSQPARWVFQVSRGGHLSASLPIHVLAE
ncbi:hypothetical protein EP7_001929 [Isosphaeraceae bacterium EP7]